MNAKCGNMEQATKLFEEMPKKDLISYCSMIQGLSYHGHGNKAVHLFNKIINEGLVMSWPSPSSCQHVVMPDSLKRVGTILKG